MTLELIIVDFIVCTLYMYVVEEKKNLLTLTFVEYNWPKIPGSFLTPEECAHSYGKFARIHISHVDPICFRAAIFATLLARWCREYQNIFDSNIFCSANPEFWMLLKM